MVERRVPKCSYHSFGRTTPLNRYCGTLATLYSPNPLKTIAISTEGIDGLIVRCTAEKVLQGCRCLYFPVDHKRTGAPSIAHLRWVGSQRSTSHNAFAVDFALPLRLTDCRAARAVFITVWRHNFQGPNGPLYTSVLSLYQCPVSEVIFIIEFVILSGVWRGFLRQTQPKDPEEAHTAATLRPLLTYIARNF
jgi:hypothetical protein